MTDQTLRQLQRRSLARDYLPERDDSVDGPSHERLIVDERRLLDGRPLGHGNELDS